MLQQTQVMTATPYFERFVAAFPDIERLASAELEQVLKCWEGLGYYSRARNLHKAAGILVAAHRGRLPCTYDQLLDLPGIGSYTAAAVASIAFGQPVPVVDGNVLRTFARFWAIREDVRSAAVRKRIFEQLEPLIRQSSAPSAFNQAVMELGALICRPRTPDCERCPLRSACAAERRGLTGQLPSRSKRAATPHYQIAVGVIWHDGKLLITRRGLEQMLGGLWEFPGGKQEPDETLEETVVREVQEEVALLVAPTGKLCEVQHAYSHFSITLTAFHCHVLSGTVCPADGRPFRWAEPRDLDRFPFPQANKRVLAELLRQHPSQRVRGPGE